MRARLWVVGLVMWGCGGGGGNGDPDAALPDTPPPCSDQPGTRFLMESSNTFGTLPSASFPGQVCVQGTTNCVQTATTGGGVFLLCAPATGGFGLELVATGFDKVVHLHGEGTTAVGFGVADVAFAEDHMWLPAGAAMYPPTDKGNLIVLVARDREPAFPIAITGASLTLSPAPARAVFYVGDDGEVDPALTTTSEAGVGLVADVDPGMYDITVSGATECHLFTGAGFESPVAGAAVRAPVTAGKTTAVTLYCVPPR